MKAASAVKKLYPYQERDINILFEKIATLPQHSRILYQLPTGGGKTVVFSEIAKRFIETSGSKVMILTHRAELCRQTAITLKNSGVQNAIINSKSKKADPKSDCYVAMIETLKNRIKSKKIQTQNIGLVIIDEAHHNSFRKLLGNFKNAFVIGVTATPFSSDVSVPMNVHYNELVTGENIQSLIDGGFLAKPMSHAYEVELNTLKTGIHGDYTVSSSNELYSSPAMLKLLLEAYESKVKGSKTLIFNNGIDTSLKVAEFFSDAGIPIKHLDNHTPNEERKEILKWFKKTKGAVLTSVSILTTGFDEPTVQAVILNRATTSVTLYHQMIGRGARRLASKNNFTIIDIGNNIQRFGQWHEPVDWKFVFENPADYAAQLQYHTSSGSAVQSHAISAELRARFPNTLEMAFDIEGNLQDVAAHHLKPKRVIQFSIRQQALMCLENAETLSEALALAEALAPEIEWRVKQYVKAIDKASKNYKDWLIEDYNDRLQRLIKKLFHSPVLQKVAG
ncbi:DEAD/DEAH box helicase [Flavobacterium noncentrifugens]|uniref:Helicase conserved C-terminal domain-containing protein n=1 Tax=Flavobacterium noncentrifugens TaxID=1128970 RepID=A0A1G8YCM4_9FLAO|nr:DEAD/DEAH box helicase [Flavobacterium noncentrifugens]GEP51170.1 DEAD/DEAH box helicase [Flavobacterium noncentrifugens]SDK00447.1 Helicase conserved C-terminal domain-containing protein [Flavobacterium noncentrifugens]